MSERKHLKPVLPPLDDERMWASVYNALLFLEKDRELEWLRHVREVVEEAEQEKRRGVV